MSENPSITKKYSKIHLVKMVRCITGLSLKESVEITEKHMSIEDDLWDMSKAYAQRELMQDDILNKMLNNKIKIEIDKEIERLQKIRSEI